VVRFHRSLASGDIPAEYDEHAVTVAPRKHEAAGVRAVLVSVQRGLAQMGAVRTAAALSRLNQRHGFDCPGCAWPEEHGGRKLAEFCENGAKAVAEEATKRTVTPEFFAKHSVAELSAKPEYWLSQQGRLAHPMVLRPGEHHYQPISWDGAYELIAEQLNALDNPDQAVFYTSGRTSNEAAFCYQLLVRSFGTNNLPDCSNMRHESSGSALTESIGIGKGSVTVDDVEHADLIVIAGQNPGTNHPPMLSVLEKAKANGAKIIAVNPLPEAGLIRFKDPQKVNGVVGHAREFHTSTGKANFAINPLQWVPVPPGRLVLQTLRSHDQCNTTIYGLDDRYRGVKGGRRVVFVNPADIETPGLKAGQRVDLVSEWNDAGGRLQERRAKDFLVVEYSTPVGNAAAYYPETNPLVPLDHTAAKSNTPVSKAITVRLEPAS
jgi:anaerobic selenocysteine-containing dehydrogenase